MSTTCGQTNTPEERFSLALHSAARSWRQALDRRLKYLGLGQASWMAIATIAKNGVPPSQTELAHKLGVEDPTMVSMLDRLVKGGLVARQPSATDRRVKLVVLTEAGAEIYGKVLAEAAPFRAELLQGMDPANLLIVTEFLEALQNRMEAIP